AREIRADSRLTRSGLVLGTPVYMSPEQIQDREIGQSSDLFSFASVCFEALTGRRTVESTDLVDVFVEILKETPPPVSRFVPECPPSVDNAFARALDKDPSRRPASILTWSRSVARWLHRLESQEGGWDLTRTDPEPGASRTRGDLPPTEAG
ncbi:MAG: protein kinase, partial [Thermoanaerobaculia bacterium]|nr:protein kinase [Thermoanaerobaculia bacterium]